MRRRGWLCLLVGVVVSVSVVPSVWGDEAGGPDQPVVTEPVDPADSGGQADADGPAESGVVVVDAQSAPDAESAGLIAAEFGHSVVVEDSLTPTESVRVLPDGLSELTVNSEPVRANVSGEWAPLDLSLRVVDGVLRPVNAAVPVELSAGGSGVLMRVQSEDGDWVSESWSLGSLPAPVVSGSRAVYGDVAPDVDLAVTVRPAGVSQVLVVKSAAAAADPALEELRLSLVAPDLSIEPDVASRSIVAADAGGEPVLASSSAIWWDSSQPDAGVNGPGEWGVLRAAPSSVDSAGATLRVGDVGDTAGVTFPLYVDPDWSTSKTGYTFVDSAYPSSGYWNGAGAADAYAHVGSVSPYIGGGTDDGLYHKARSFWNFSLGGLAGKHVLSANFNGQLHYSNSCENVPTELWLTSAVSASTTWNSQPVWQAKMGSANHLGGRSGCSGEPAFGFNVLAGVVNNLEDGWSTVTFGMHSSDEANYYGWRKYYSAATLVATYNNPPGVPGSLSVTPCAYVCSGTVITRSQTPKVAAAAQDPNGDNVRYDFEVWDQHLASPITRVAAWTTAYVASGTQVASTVPVTLQASRGYEYRVRACDSVECSGWTGWVRFTVDSVKPLQPTLTMVGSWASTNPNSFGGHVGDSGWVTVHPAAGDNAYGYVYRVAPRGVSMSFPSGLSCGSTSLGYKMVCPSATNGDVSVPVTLPTAVSSLTVWTVDAAGNTNSDSATLSFYAFDSVLPKLGHQWRISTTATACPTAAPASLPDTASPAFSLTAGGVCWKQATVRSLDTAASWVISYDSTDTSKASKALVDTTGSFSVAAWVRPVSASSGVQTVISQESAAGARSAFLLQAGANYRFCVYPSQSGSAVCTTGPAVTPGVWVFVAGVYERNKLDVASSELKLYVSADGSESGGPNATATIGQVNSSSGPTMVGRATDANGPTQYFTGDVFLPTVMQGPASESQLTQIGYDYLKPSELS